jgi:hypothetical protein
MWVFRTLCGALTSADMCQPVTISVELRRCKCVNGISARGKVIEVLGVKMGRSGRGVRPDEGVFSSARLTCTY